MCCRDVPPETQRCECGEYAVVQVAITQFTALGVPRVEWLTLCPACYAEHLETERFLADELGAQGAPRLSVVPVQHGRRGAKLTAEVVARIRALHAAGDYTNRELAVLYGVNEHTVSRIVKRLTWTDVG